MNASRRASSFDPDVTVTTDGQVARGSLIAMLVLLLTWAFSDWGRAVAAGASALAIYMFIDGCWAYRRSWWLWTIFALLTVAHVVLVCLVGWPNWGKGNLLMIIAGGVEGIGLQALASRIGIRSAGA